MAEKSLGDEPNELYMIGNSHIDPVWFWTWEEGMQEVKATYASVLDRMEEFPEFCFTSTSSLFFEWLDQIAPEMMDRIAEQVAAGRWEVTGGFYNEPDCLLPGGESYARQLLYGQRYLWRRFGQLAEIGSNVDSFGHNLNLPQLLKKGRINSYVFMRPALDNPLFNWEAPDGSVLLSFCLPGEYTTWFYEPTRDNILTTLKKSVGFPKMACFYGVGNHGGGPTIENIKSIKRLQQELSPTKLSFSPLSAFIKGIDQKTLSTQRGSFEEINQGCYSIDSAFKKLHRQAERQLIKTDAYLACAALTTGSWMKETGEMEALWKELLFNQFHDTLGGTIIHKAREEAYNSLAGVLARANTIMVLARQKLVNHFNTAGKGSPLFVFNVSNSDLNSCIEAEVDWFCKSPLSLYSPQGDIIPYQRLHTQAKTRNYNIGGRRRILFPAHLPAYSVAQYRLTEEGLSEVYTPNWERLSTDALLLENDHLRVVFDPHYGSPCLLEEKSTGYQGLASACHYVLYQDERDSWGGEQGRPFKALEKVFVVESMEKIESGPYRETIRSVVICEQTRIEQYFSLSSEDHSLQVSVRLLFGHPWHLLKMVFPFMRAIDRTLSESAYGLNPRTNKNNIEYSMQRFVDVLEADGSGILIANDSKYAFNIEGNALGITLGRSAIFAQGNSKDWYDPLEDYRYHDLGVQDFSFRLCPHADLSIAERYQQEAMLVEAEPEYLLDSCHRGMEQPTAISFFAVDQKNISIMALKKAEDGRELIIRLLETGGRRTEYTLKVGGSSFQLQIEPFCLDTYKIDWLSEKIEKVDLLEWPDSIVTVEDTIT